MPLRVVTFKVEEELLREMDIYSEELGMNRSEFIRYAIERLIEELSRDNGKHVEEAPLPTIIY
jgi:metal-responsive CopG/Arc/MetJ family transcriptional regulator